MLIAYLLTEKLILGLFVGRFGPACPSVFAPLTHTLHVAHMHLNCVRS